MKTVIVIAACALAGCAARPGIVAAPDGTLTVMRRGADLSASTSLLKVQAMKDADAYCAARQKRANVVDSREIPSVGHWPEAQIKFTCE